MQGLYNHCLKIWFTNMKFYHIWSQVESISRLLRNSSLRQCYFEMKTMWDSYFSILSFIIRGSAPLCEVSPHIPHTCILCTSISNLPRWTPVCGQGRTTVLLFGMCAHALTHFAKSKNIQWSGTGFTSKQTTMHKSRKFIKNIKIAVLSYDLHTVYTVQYFLTHIKNA